MALNKPVTVGSPRWYWRQWREFVRLRVSRARLDVVRDGPFANAERICGINSRPAGQRSSPLEGTGEYCVERKTVHFLPILGCCLFAFGLSFRENGRGTAGFQDQLSPSSTRLHRSISIIASSSRGSR